MDLRNRIVDDVIRHLSGRISDHLIDMVSDALTIELDRYELQIRCTDLSVPDRSPEAILKRFLACKRLEGASENTIRRYREINLELIRFMAKPLEEISTYDLRFYLSLRRDRDGVSNVTLDGMRRIYSSFFKWLSAERIVAYNPCLALSKIKCKKQIKKAFSATELERIREACETDRELALVHFLYATGVRVSECASIDISDVDFGTLEIIVLGKGNKERKVYLSEVSAMYLKKYLATREDQSPALFVGRKGRRLGKTGIEVAVKKIGQRAGVENVHPHRFRRTLATQLLNRGMDIVSVAEILGHADLRTTQIYCSISNKNIKYSYQKLLAA